MNSQPEVFRCRLADCENTSEDSVLVKHPFLPLLFCLECRNGFVEQRYDYPAWFEPGAKKDGHESYCLMCWWHGFQFVCSGCPRVMCYHCVDKTFGQAVAERLEADPSDWLCFCCDPQQDKQSMKLLERFQSRVAAVKQNPGVASASDKLLLEEPVLLPLAEQDQLLLLQDEARHSGVFVSSGSKEPGSESKAKPKEMPRSIKGPASASLSTTGSAKARPKSTSSSNVASSTARETKQPVPRKATKKRPRRKLDTEDTDSDMNVQEITDSFYAAQQLDDKEMQQHNPLSSKSQSQSKSNPTSTEPVFRPVSPPKSPTYSLPLSPSFKPEPRADVPQSQQQQLPQQPQVPTRLDGSTQLSFPQPIPAQQKPPIPPLRRVARKSTHVGSKPVIPQMRNGKDDEPDAAPLFPQPAMTLPLPAAGTVTLETLLASQSEAHNSDQQRRNRTFVKLPKRSVSPFYAKDKGLSDSLRRSPPLPAGDVQMPEAFSRDEKSEKDSLNSNMDTKSAEPKHEVSSVNDDDVSMSCGLVIAEQARVPSPYESPPPLEPDPYFLVAQQQQQQQQQQQMQAANSIPSAATATEHKSDEFEDCSLEADLERLKKDPDALPSLPAFLALPSLKKPRVQQPQLLDSVVLTSESVAQHSIKSNSKRSMPAAMRDSKRSSSSSAVASNNQSKSSASSGLKRPAVMIPNPKSAERPSKYLKTAAGKQPSEANSDNSSAVGSNSNSSAPKPVDRVDSPSSQRQGPARQSRSVDRSQTEANRPGAVQGHGDNRMRGVEEVHRLLQILSPRTKSMQLGNGQS